jgi:hypothetical protein
MTDLAEIARGAIESHLGDVIDGDASPEDIYEEAYTIALDALVDCGVDLLIAGQIACEEATRIAQP